MDLPANDAELVPEKEIIKDGKEGCPAFHCDLYDTEVVHKVAQVLLSGLAAACVDNTTGGIFKSPASVAVDLRKEMIEYLTNRSENYVAESVVLEGDPNTEVSDDPYDIISDFVDDFASSKRNIFSRVSGWLMSENREDKVDDFVQEMETNGFWLTERRETVAQNLVKTVDFKNKFHCDEKFNTAEELAEHVVNCEFRTMNCRNEGCIFVYCARHMEKHDSACPFKVIPCEQKCSESLMRREMDRHCITVCPMKLVNCPFYGVGCQFSVPRSMIQQHCSDELQLHLACLLKNIHKGAPEGDLNNRAARIVELSSGQLQGARDARSLALRVRDIDAKLRPLEITATPKAPEEPNEPPNENTEKSTSEILKFSEPAGDNAEQSKEPMREKAVEFSEPAIAYSVKSTEPADDKANKSTESARHNTYNATERAPDNANQLAEPPSDITDKFSKTAISDATKSVESVDNVAIKRDKSTDPEPNINDAKFTEQTLGSAGKSSEPGSSNAAGLAEPASRNAAQPARDIAPESSINNRNISIDPANYNAENESNHANISTESASGNVDKSTSASEKPKNAPNNAVKDSVDTWNLTAPGSEEVKPQTST